MSLSIGYGSAAQPADGWSIRQLPLPLGCSAAAGGDLSDDASTAVGAGMTQAGEPSSVPVKWLVSQGSVATLPTDVLLGFGSARRCSANGSEIVGTVGGVGVLWTKSGLHFLSALVEAPCDSPLVPRVEHSGGISPDGLVAVGSVSRGGGPGHLLFDGCLGSPIQMAAAWQTGTAGRGLPWLREDDVCTNCDVGSWSGWANDASRYGAVIVGASSANSGATTNATAWRDGEADPIGTDLLSEAVRTTDDGVISVGYASIPSGDFRAWRSISGRSRALLPSPVNSPSASVRGLAVTFDGGLVAGDCDGEAWIYDAADGSRLLKDWLFAHGVSSPSLTSVVAIASDGRTLLVNGVNAPYIVTITRIDFIDRNTEQLREAGAGDAQLAFSGGVPRRGAVCDGVTRVVARSGSYGRQGTVHFELLDEHGNPASDPRTYGGFVAFGTSDLPQSTLDVATTAGSPSDFRGIAEYLSPIDFVRDSEDQLRGKDSPRTIKIRCTFDPLAGGRRVVDETSFELHRPPVVLVHGLNDCPLSWQWGLENDGRFDVAKPNYWSTNRSSFAWNTFNRRVVRNGIAGITAEIRRRGVAVTQADVFGHSMGGVLARIYSQGEYRGSPTGYLRPDNFHAGDIHKLVTVNTPHFGSPVSCTVMSADNLYYGGADATEQGYEALVGVDPGVCRAPAQPMTSGAIADLRPDSAAISSMNSVAGGPPVHAIVGNSDVDNSQHPYAVRTYRMATWLCDYTSAEAFMGGPSDAVVPVASQLGGLNGNCFTMVFGDQGLHYPIIADVAASPARRASAVGLLNASVASDRFHPGGFPANAMVPIPCAPCSLTEVGGSLSLDIADPLTTSIATTIGVFGFGGLTLGELDRVRIVLPDGTSVEAIAPDWRVTWTVPHALLGFHQISAHLIRDDRPTTLTTSSVVRIVNNSPIAGFTVPTAPITLNRYTPTAEVLPAITLTNGFTHQVSGDDGVVFASHDPSVASVDSGGIVRGGNVGRTLVSATYQGATTSVPVWVEETKRPSNITELVDPGNGEAITPVALSGDGSSVVGRTPAGPAAILLPAQLFPLQPVPSLGNPTLTAASYDASTVVGYGFQNAMTSGCVWTSWWAPGTNVFDVEPFEPSEAHGVSSDGLRVVGTASVAGTFAATRWIRNHPPEHLLMPPGSVLASALACDASATVIAGIGRSAENIDSAVRWIDGQPPEFLGTLPGKLSSRPRAVSADGTTIVGESWTLPSDRRAFRWQQTSGIVDLGTLGSFSTARAVSADGSIVVGQSRSASGSFLAFIWTNEAGMESLSSFLARNGVDVAGWVLKDAVAISHDGSVITGSGLLNSSPTSWAITNVPHPCPQLSEVSGPADASTCSLGLASFDITVLPTANVQYHWQLEVSANSWITLADGRVPYQGSSIAVLGATTPHLSLAWSSIRRAPPLRVHCTTTNQCSESTSRDASFITCAPDYDCSGSLSVQDIFVFLASYFAGEARADFNESDGRTVQDIFEFLAAYFAGCP